ncbi:MAG: mechanosensitive ion channel family protein [Desulfobacterales bacterium]
MKFMDVSFWRNMEFLDIRFWGNSVKEWLTALVVAITVVIFLRLVKWILVRYLTNRADQDRWDVVELTAIAARRTQLPFVMIFAIYAGFQVLDLPQRLPPWIFSITMAALILQLTLWANATVDYFLNRSQQRTLERNAARVTTLRAAGLIVKLVLAAIAAILILDNIPGVEITALVASLGITGIAVALAVQNILSDLFASLSIVLDKPFVIGDFIIVDNYMGTVEHIGLKTTRVRSLSGEQLIFSNNDLLQSRVRNYKRMAERRVVFSIGVTYQTPLEKLKQIPATIRQIIESQETARFDRAHFQGYGDFALNFEVVYYMLDPDYNRYMDIQQAINMAIFRSFEEMGVDFAYPTQTLYLDGKIENESQQPLTADAT